MTETLAIAESFQSSTLIRPFKGCLTNFCPLRRIAIHRNTPNGRTHQTPYGWLPGVTTILGQTFPVDFSQWRRDNPQKAQDSLQRGITLHKQIEDFWVRSRMAESKLFSLAYQIVPHIDLICWEHQVYSELGYSGSLDAVGYWGGTLTLFDWKTSGKKKTPSQVVDYLIQVAAYSKALKELDGIEVDRCSVVILCELLDSPQLFEIEGDEINYYFDMFLERLNAYQRMVS